MSSRAAPPHLSPRDRDRDRSYARDGRDRDAGSSRTRSRSPRRDRDRYDDRDRRYDRDRPRGSDREPERDRYRGGSRERDGDGYRDDRYSRRAYDDDRTGGRSGVKNEPSRDGGSRDPPRAPYTRDNPNSDPSFRTASSNRYDGPPPAQLRGGPGAYGGGYNRGGPYGGQGGYGGAGIRGDDYERPLDRRAIEEGRRRREEERAKGIVYTEDGSINPSQEASPAPKEEPKEEVDENDPEAAMASMMGFGGFGTTKGKAVEANADGAVKVNKQRTWRQYMNRRGGFNRPLDKVKD
ncbi:hypothetical protein I317_03510 [Kwoniella heveanensis CBS 569]|uniref:U4/U6.U5 small nuclear ribonucleoprotein 27kDa protein domain-containing protein n=1 Tax=Kwoniella heveanensis BCC8398 TaxID=1296120 RepID=A0A1B9GTU3_9TREE|nr:hypothetical protein I316_03950 [Kwoniella heveanensis BCC8398]OCF42651.1 hypothetical protein I317_03510 [Kwoniella heveanensis CBS 569]